MKTNLIKACTLYLENHGQVSENQKPCFRMFDIDMSEADAFLRYHRDLTFHERLFLLIDRTGQRDSTIYKRAGVDRRLFSKIRSNEDYIPSKKTVLAFCLALELNREESDLLLSSAGYSLSRADDYDLVIAFCIDKKIYDIYEVNEVLVHFGFEVF